MVLFSRFSKLPKSCPGFGVVFSADASANGGAQFYLGGVEHGSRFQVSARYTVLAVLLVGEQCVRVMKKLPVVVRYHIPV